MPASGRRPLTYEAAQLGRLHHARLSRSEGVPDRLAPARKPTRLLLGSGSVDRGSADLNAMRLTLLGLRDADLQHPLVEARADPLRVNMLRQSQRPGEATERPLDAVVVI